MSLQPRYVEQGAITGPRLRQPSIGIGRGLGIAARLVELSKSVESPAIVGRVLECALEFLERIVVAAGLQQGGSKRLAHGIVPVRRLGVAQAVLDGGGFTEACDRG